MYIELLTCASHFISCALVLIFITCLKIDMLIFLFDKERTMRLKKVPQVRRCLICFWGRVEDSH